MEITKEKYKEILEIQSISYNENSRWFEETLTRINQVLQEQEPKTQEVCTCSTKIRLDGSMDFSMCRKCQKEVFEKKLNK